MLHPGSAMRVWERDSVERELGGLILLVSGHLMTCRVAGLPRIRGNELAVKKWL
jgi:hypothetical protein